MLQNILFEKKCGSFEIPIHQRIQKSIPFSTKIWSNTTLFNIDNYKKFEQQISILEWFWRSCDTEDWSNDAEIQLRITGINYILKYIHIKNSLFWIVFYIS